MDGHYSHSCPEVIQAAAAEKVILFLIQHICLNLWTRGALVPLKLVGRRYVTSLSKNPGPRFEFSQLLSKAWYKAMTMPNIVESAHNL